MNPNPLKRNCGKRHKFRDEAIKEPEFKESHPQELINMMSKGMLDYEVCAEWGISRDTFSRWLKEKENLKFAYEIGYLKCFQWWFGEGKKRFAEKTDKGFKFWQVMMTKFSDLGFGRETNQSGTSVNIHNLNVLQSSNSEQELLESIKSNFLKLSSPAQVKVIDIAPEIKEITYDPESGQTDAD